MFGVSWFEMLIVGVIALMVMGEEKFPDFVKIAIRAFRDFRGYWDEIKGEVEREVRKPLEREFQPLRSELQKLTRLDPETYLKKMTETAPPENKAPSTQATIAASPDMGTPAEYALPVESAAAPVSAEPAREADEPAGTVNSEDAKVMASGATPYAGGGLGARSEAAPTEVPAAATEAPPATTEAPKPATTPLEDEHLPPPTRID